MQERRLRLGDVLDDYCPREKRLSNHVIVAIVGDEVRQTRCTTCDTEHPYKHGRVPARRKKADAPEVLYKQVLDNLTGKEGQPSEDVPPAGLPIPPPAVAAAPVAPPAAARPVPARVAPAPAAAEQPTAAVAAVQAPAAVPQETPVAAASAQDDETPREEPVHRHQLIRATLPRIEGQVPERKPAEFTLWHVSRHAQGRRGQRQRPADGNVGYSPFGNGHPKAPVNPNGRQTEGKPSRRRRRR